MTDVKITLAIISSAAILLAIAVPLLVRHLSRQTGFTGLSNDKRHAVIASDVGAVPPVMVRDPLLGVRGVPDYVVTVDVDGRRGIAPVELKPRRAYERLLESDRLQLGAYLLGLRASLGDAASPVGFVHYRSTRFAVRLTPALEEKIQRIVTAIRRGRSASTLHRSHQSAARCRGCAVRALCDESLADS